MGLPFERSVRNASSRAPLSRVVCLLPAACCLLFSLGCNSGKQLQADLYQRELRLQEDEIYRLEDNLEEYQAIVRGYRCEVADLKQELAGVRSRPTRGSEQSVPVLAPIEGPEFSPTPSSPHKSSTEQLNNKPFPAPDAAEAPPFAPSADATNPQSGDVATLVEHKLSLSQDERSLEEEREVQASPLKKLNVDAAKKKLVLLKDAEPPLPFPPTQATPIAESIAKPLPAESLASAPPASDPSANRKIAAFVEPVQPKAMPTERTTPLLKLATVDSVRVELQNGPRESTGEATLIAKLSPRAGGEAAYFEGEASILLADMSRRGKRRRIGRWDFSTDEVAQSWAEDSTQLELPLLLPADLVSKTPTDRPLRLWVRLVDTHGRKTLHSIDVDFLDRPWRLAETRPIESIQARPIELASRPIERLSAEGDNSVALTEEQVAQVKQASTNQSGWKRAILHRSNVHKTLKRDGAVKPAMYTNPNPSLR